MKKYSEAFIGFDTAKKKHAVAIAEDGRNGEIRYLGEIDGEIRYLGEIDSSPATVEKVIGKLAERYAKLHVCYEAGPTGYGLYRQVKALGHECAVVAPSLIPRKSGERIKTNRRDAVTLARSLRAGDLTSVWVPDAIHEAVRDLSRAREAAGEDVRKKRQQLLSFLLRHGRIFSGRKHWSLAHRRWLAEQKFEHPAQQIVFQDAIDAIEDGAARLRRLEEQLLAIAPSWSMAPVVAAYQAMRGVSFIVAVTFVAEIGDVRRFDNPRQLMAFLGLIPSERSTGETVRRSRSRAIGAPDACSSKAPGPTAIQPVSARPCGPGSRDCRKPSATSPGKPRSGSAPGTVASPPPARRRRWSLPQSPARWLRSFGPSHTKSNH